MVQQVTRQAILTFIEAHPKALVKDIAAHCGITTNLTAAKLKGYYDNGFVDREVAGRIPSGKEFYAYTVVPNVKDKPRKERKAIQAKETLDNARPSLAKPPEISTLIQTLSEALAKQIAAQVVVSLQGQLQRELAAVIPPLVEVPKLTLPVLPVGTKSEIETSTHQPTVRKPKIGVVGLGTAKRHALVMDYGDLLDLKFWCSDEGENILKSLAISCEQVFVLQFVGHKHTQMLTSRGAKWAMVPGDIASLRQKLTDYCVEHAK